MSKNKYILDLNVGVVATPQKEEKKPEPLQSIGSGWSSASKPVTAEPDATSFAPLVANEIENITCTLMRAYFVPDKNTNFNFLTLDIRR